MFKILYSFIFLAISFSVSAQTEIQDSAANSIAMDADFRIEELNQRYANGNKNKKINGYRIQIFSGSRTEADEVREQFMRAFPELEPFKKWDYPNFKVQIGNFVNQLDAQRSLPEIKSVFSDAFVARSQIDIPEFQDLEKE